MSLRVQIRLLTLSVLIVTVNTLPVFLTGAAFFAIGPELGMGPLGLGAITAAFFLAAAATSAPLGRWVQRVGWRKAMRLNVINTALWASLVAPFAHNGWVLGGFLIASALMYGCANPSANQALARHTNPARHATVFGLKHAGIPASTLLAGLAVPVVVLRFGWRPAFLIAAVAALAVWLLIPFKELDQPARTASVHESKPLTLVDLRLLAVVAALGAIGSVALGTFLVSSALDKGIDEATAGWLQFVGSGASIGARVVAGMIVDRGRSSLTGMVILLGAGAVMLTLVPLLPGVLFMAAVVAAYATSWGWPGLMTATVVGADRSLAARSSGVTQAGVFFGAGGAPLMLGFVAEKWSYTPMWLLAASLVVVALVFALAVSARRKLEAAPLGERPYPTPEH